MSERRNDDYDVFEDNSYALSDDETKVFKKTVNPQSADEPTKVVENLDSFSDDYRMRKGRDFGDGYDQYNDEDDETADRYDRDYDDNQGYGNDNYNYNNRNPRGGGGNRNNKNKGKIGIIIAICAAIVVAGVIIAIALVNGNKADDANNESSSSSVVSESTSVTTETTTAATYETTTAPTTTETTTATTATTQATTAQTGNAAGSYAPSNCTDSSGTPVELSEAFGTSFSSYGGSLDLSSDGSFSIYMGVSDWSGTYTYGDGVLKMSFSGGPTQTCTISTNGGNLNSVTVNLDGFNVTFN